MSKKELIKLANQLAEELSEDFRKEIDSNNIVFEYNESIIKREIKDELSLLQKELPTKNNLELSDLEITRISKLAVKSLNEKFKSSTSKYLTKDENERNRQIESGKIFLSGEGSTFRALSRLIKDTKDLIITEVEKSLALNFNQLLREKKSSSKDSSYTIQFLNIEHVYSVSDLRIANTFLRAKGSVRKTKNFLEKLKQNSSNLVAVIIDDYILNILSKTTPETTSLKEVTLELEWKSERRNKEVGRQQINARKRALVKYLNLTIQKQINTQKTLRTSDSLEELYTQKVINTVDSALPKAKRINKKLNTNKIKTASSLVKKKFSVSSQLKAKKKITMGRSGISAPEVPEDRSMGASPLQVLTYINSRLPTVVEKNMEFPRLEFQTGRFARSVKAVNILQTKQGFPSIEYTYQRDPYQVFEMGLGRSPWATPQRDPRKLIDTSIREIAAEMLRGRIYTRRV